MTEKELIGLYKNEGNLEARELLVSKYYKFVISNLRKLVRYEFPYAALEKEDYLSITYECIISIGLKYDLADTKLSFREYLYTNIKYTLLRLIKPFMHGCSVLITSNKSGASK
jgi:DNA-directed RNA polymerase specialized sigma subunit